MVTEFGYEHPYEEAGIKEKYNPLDDYQALMDYNYNYGYKIRAYQWTN